MNTKLLKCSKKSNYSDFLEHFNDILIMEKTDIGIPNYVLISPKGTDFIAKKQKEYHLPK